MTKIHRWFFFLVCIYASVCSHIVCHESTVFFIVHLISSNKRFILILQFRIGIDLTRFSRCKWQYTIYNTDKRIFDWILYLMLLYISYAFEWNITCFFCFVGSVFIIAQVFARTGKSICTYVYLCCIFRSKYIYTIYLVRRKKLYRF